MSPNISILLKGVLISRLTNNPFASCFLINLAFLVLHTAHFDNIIFPPFIVLKSVDKCFWCFLRTLENKTLFLFTIFSSFFNGIAFKTKYHLLMESY